MLKNKLGLPNTSTENIDLLKPKIDLKTMKREEVIEMFDFQDYDSQYIRSGITTFKRSPLPGTYGWIKDDGTILAEGFYRCGIFVEDCAMFETISKRGSCGFINKNGEIANLGFNAIHSFYNGHASYETVDREKGIILTKISEGYLIMEGDPKMFGQGWISTEGIILAKGFDKCYPFENGLARYERYGKTGYITKELIEFEEVIKYGKPYLKKNGKIYLKEVITNKLIGKNP